MKPIRKASEKDCRLMAEINIESKDPLNKLFKVNKKDLTNYFKNLIKEKKAEFYIYNQDGIIGFKKDFPGFNNCEIFWLSVAGKFQNKGIGKELVGFIESYAKKIKCKAVYLYTHPIHKKAIAFYKKLKYKKINEFPNYYSNGDKSILFGKRLV